MAIRSTVMMVGFATTSRFTAMLLLHLNMFVFVGNVLDPLMLNNVRQVLVERIVKRFNFINLVF